MTIDRFYFVIHKSSFKMYLSLSLSILIILFHTSIVIGQLTLSPMMMAPVCLGDQVNLTCTASVEFIEWSFTVINEQGRDEEFTIFSTARGSSRQSMPIVVNSTNFTVIRDSGERVLPLASTLSIDSVSIGLNGTVVNCMDPGNTLTPASTTIHIIDTSNNHHTLILRIISVVYSTDNVTVTVEWTEQMGGMYNVTVVPPVSIMLMGSTSCHLTISYNREYNLTVKTTVPCQPSTTATKRLNYVKCEYPELLPTSTDSFPTIESNKDLSTEGSIIRFSCPPGLSLIGPNLATCMENGEWEPDLSDLMCNDSKEIMAKAPNEDGWTTISSSAAAAGFAGMFIVFFVVVLCYLCRRWHRKKTLNITIKSLHPPVTYKKPDHIYDEIDHDVPTKQELGTKKNMAYYSTVK